MPSSFTTHDKSAFLEKAGSQCVIAVVHEVTSPSLDPVELYRGLCADRPATFLMDSAIQGTWGRYSFLGLSAAATFSSDNGVVKWNGPRFAALSKTLLVDELVQKLLTHLATPAERDTDVPFLNGLVGYFDWDMVRSWEKLPLQPTKDLALPEAYFGLVAEMLVIDHQEEKTYVVANSYQFDDKNPLTEKDYQHAVARIDGIQTQLNQLDASLKKDDGSKPRNSSQHSDQVQTITPHESWLEQSYFAAIEESKKAIYDGEVFQIVISRRFEQDNTATPLEVYQQLRRANPSPYMYLTNCERTDGEPFHIVGSSPEALVTVRDGHVITHPIAGTRPRGANAEQDQQHATDLLADEKEKSEHLMLVDLSRNDLAKVCTAGTVTVTSFMELVRYSHVMHLVSVVEGELAADKTAYAALRATFPAGTLSGAPKPRALQLIDEYEPHSRGVYGGVVGYFDFKGNMDMAIAIRTVVLLGDKAYVQAGGGIVADSSLKAEGLESRNKAAAPLRAVAAAQHLHRNAES